MSCSINCGGKCCAVFYLGRTKEEWLAIEDPSAEQKVIADMIIPLTNAEAVARQNDLNGNPDWQTEAPEGHYFTCRHWDQTTGLCTIYDRRPRMCSDYPYDFVCQYKGCGGIADEATAVRWRVIHEPKLLPAATAP